MGYRNIAKPAGCTDWYTEDWIRWADSERLFPAVAPAPDGTCQLCFGSVGTAYTGQPFEMCKNCRNYGALDAVVPAVYSRPEGFESLLHRYKDFDYPWLVAPFASLLWHFLTGHVECIVRRHGPIALATTMPSGSANRSFHHLNRAIEVLAHGDWGFHWELDLIRNVVGDRPSRGTVMPGLYQVRRDQRIGHGVVLLVDDTWTSGATMASVAAALKAAGAKTVVGVPMGRQLGTGTFGTTQQIISTIAERGFDGGRCVLCE
jgi:predicted amidophosphoribosyltransferase